MSKINPNDPLIHYEPCILSNLNLFSGPFRQYSIEKCWQESVRKVAPLFASVNTIDFIVEPSPIFLVPSEFELKLQIKITNSNNTDLGANAVIGFVQNPLDSVFKDFDLRIGQSSITSTYNTHPYVCFLNKLFGYQWAARNLKLQTTG